MPKKILIADDEPDVLEVIQFRLSKRGYTVILAANGQEALESINRERPDLVILDFRMPLLDGFQVCQRLKEDENLKNIPVIILSASSDVLSEEKLLAAHADGALKKPFEPEELFRIVDKFLKSEGEPDA